MVDYDRRHDLELAPLSEKMEGHQARVMVSFERSPSANFEIAIARLSPLPKEALCPSLSRNTTRKIFSQDEGKFGCRLVQNKTANISWLKSKPTNPGQLARADAKSKKGRFGNVRHRCEPDRKVGAV